MLYKKERLRLKSNGLGPELIFIVRVIVLGVMVLGVIVLVLLKKGFAFAVPRSILLEGMVFTYYGLFN